MRCYSVRFVEGRTDRLCSPLDFCRLLLGSVCSSDCVNVCFCLCHVGGLSGGVFCLFGVYFREVSDVGDTGVVGGSGGVVFLVDDFE